MTQIKKLKEARTIFIAKLCQYFNVVSLNDLYDTDPTTFVRKITSIESCKDLLKILTPYISDTHVRPVERLYHILYDYYEPHPVKCKKCGVNPTKFTNDISKGYRQYCCNKCRLADASNINIKTQNTYFEKTGFKNVSQDPHIKQKKKETTIKHYGCSNKEVIKKRQENYLKKTGYNHPFQNPDVKNKIKQAHLDRSGFENPSFNPEIIQKRIATYQNKTGFTCALQNPDIQATIRQIWLEKYGVDNPAKSSKIQQKISQTQRFQFFSRLLNSDRLKTRYEPQFSIDDYVGVKGNRQYLWKCLRCGMIFSDDIDNGNLPRCTSCYPVVGTSLSESEVADFCKNYCELPGDREALTKNSRF